MKTTRFEDSAKVASKVVGSSPEDFAYDKGLRW